jgi:glycosyltransferase involved in cell wall biosynthesis
MSEIKTPKSIWITWEVQPRNRSMSKLMGVALYEIIINRSRLIKYPFLIIRTLLLLIKIKPEVLFVQNPSIVLAYISLIFKYLISYKLVVDAHNAGIYPLEGKSRFLNYITRRICGNADMIIVTNSALANQVKIWGGDPFVMPDPLPDYEGRTASYDNKSIKDFLLICTWSDDEPYSEIIKAAQLLEGKINLRITGNYKKKLTDSEVSNLSKNITLLGFVSENDYINELSLADCTIDLTTRENCLVCGAYESIAMGVPGILSEGVINRSTFPTGFIFSQNDSESISLAMLQALDNLSSLRSDVVEMKNTHESRIALYKNQIVEKVFNQVTNI